MCIVLKLERRVLAGSARDGCVREMGDIYVTCIVVAEKRWDFDAT